MLECTDDTSRETVVVAAALALGGAGLRREPRATSPARRPISNRRSRASSARSSTRPTAAAGRRASPATWPERPAAVLPLTEGVVVQQSRRPRRAPSRGAIRVIPGDPDNSYLIQQARGRAGHRRRAHAAQRRALPDRRARLASSAAGSSWARTTTEETRIVRALRPSHAARRWRCVALAVPAGLGRRPSAGRGGGSGPRGQRLAAGLQSRGAAHQPAAAEGQVRVPRDAPLRAAARRRRLRRPAGGFLRLRLGRADRPRAALRAVPRRAGRHQPHLGSHHPVLRPVRSARTSSRSRWAWELWASMDGTNNFRDSYSPALGAGGVARAGATTARCTPSRSGSTTPTPSPRSWSTTTTRSSSASARGCDPADRLRHRGGVAARRRLRARRRAHQLRRREARGRPRVSAELLQRLRDDDGPDCARRDRATTTGTSASTSRASSTELDITGPMGPGRGSMTSTTVGVGRMAAAALALAIAPRAAGRRLPHLADPDRGRRRRRRRTSPLSRSQCGRRLAVHRHDSTGRPRDFVNNDTDRTTWRRIRIRLTRTVRRCEQVGFLPPASRDQRQLQHRAHLRLPRSQPAGDR